MTIEEHDVTSIDRQIEVALVAVCYFILLTIGTQMFAVVNQRRYRSGFWLSFATFALTVLLVVIYTVYIETKMGYSNADKKVSPEQ